MKKSQSIKGYDGQNPFKDHQARTFDGDKIVKEFHPTSKFWSLFNDQHEILIGRRGSGKTILLKMMRYSLLKKMSDSRASEIINQKKYIGVYVPTHMEFIGQLRHQEVNDKDKLLFFQFAFNCFIARAFLYEINSIISDEKDSIDSAYKSREIARVIYSVWFPKKKIEHVNSIENLDKILNDLYENTELTDSLNNIPKVLRNTICRPIQAVSSQIYKLLEFEKEPTWIVCIDEAEFIPKEQQRCINHLFRADSRGIVIKMATMPYAHETKETLTDGIFAESNGNDFSYRKVDMEEDSDDFINVTNSLIRNRLHNFPGKNGKPFFEKLDDFVEKVGNDDLIDYYQKEIDKEKLSAKKFKAKVEQDLISYLSSERQKTIESDKKKKKTIQKTILDKFFPIYFTRKMFELSKEGNRIPGWYAGPKMIRKISEGNPRQFILMMNALFEKAKTKALSPKVQHAVLIDFLVQFSKATKSLPLNGPPLFDILESIAKELHKRVHEKQHMVFTGNSFKLKKNFEYNKLVNCIKLGVGYSRITVDERSYLGEIDEDTKFSLSNSLSAFHWIPMRKGDYPRLSVAPKYKQQTLEF
jgi:hypothetical protein